MEIRNLWIWLLALNYLQVAVYAMDKTTAFACENSTMNLECSNGKVLRIIRANYGRFSNVVCNQHGKTELNLQCLSTKAVKLVAEMCDGWTKCSIKASNRQFGDPCPDTNKYLEVHYRCSEDDIIIDVTLKPPPDRVQTKSTKRPTTKTTPETRTPAKNPLPETTTSSKVPTRSTPISTTTKNTGKWQPDKPTQSTDMRVMFCKAQEVEGIWWPMTRAGHTARKPCPDKQTGLIKWKCSGQGSWPGKPDYSACMSEWVQKIDDLILADTPVEFISHRLKTFSREKVSAGDLKSAALYIMPSLNHLLRVQVNASMSKDYIMERTKNVTQDIVKAGSNFLSTNKSKTWTLLPRRVQTRIATSISINVELAAYRVATTLTVGATVATLDENIRMEVSVIDTRSKGLTDMTFPSVENLQHTSWEGSTDSITIPKRNLQQQSQKGQVTVVVTIYNNLNEYMRSSDEEAQISEENTNQINEYNVVQKNSNQSQTTHVVNSNVLSASMNERNEKTKLSEPVTFTLKHKDNQYSLNPTCSYWAYNSSTLNGRWAGDGCRTVSTNETHTTCECDHLTNFAILMDVSGTKLQPYHQVSLMIITYIGCIISIISLCLSFLTFVLFKNLQCDRNTIHKNLVLCLMLAEVVFLAGVSQTQDKVLCAVIAGVLHFLFLASFGWMCLEGIQLYVMLVEVFEAAKSRRVWYYSFGYGIPAIIVAISAGVDHQGYGTPQFCWLRTDNYFIWSFVGPVAAVITINIAMLSIAIYKMCRHGPSNTSMTNKDKKKFQNISNNNANASSNGIASSNGNIASSAISVSNGNIYCNGSSTIYESETKLKTIPEFSAWVKGAVVLVVLLGLTWSFGILFINEESVVMAYVFTILNSLQGLFIFVFHCLMTEKVQKEYRRCARRTTWLPDCIRVRYGGFDGHHLSSTPNQSLSSGNNLYKWWSGRRRKRSSTTTLPLKSASPTRSNFQKRQSDSDTGICRDSSVFHNSDNGTLTFTTFNGKPPQQNGHAQGYHDDGGIVGDLSVLDCSVVDSEYVSEYCQQNMLVSYENKRSPIPEEEYSDEKKRFSSASDDSIIKNRESFASTDKGGVESSDDESDRNKESDGLNDKGEGRPLVSDADSQNNIMNNVMTQRSTDAISSSSVDQINGYAGGIPRLNYEPEDHEEGDSMHPLLSDSVDTSAMAVEGEIDFVQASLTEASSHSNSSTPKSHRRDNPAVITGYGYNSNSSEC